MVDKTIPVPRHGGDLNFANRIYGAPDGGWLDLSTGINPNPYPAAPVRAEDLHRLPDREALALLLDAARRAYRVPDGVSLFAVPGTEIAIRLLPLVFSSRPAAVVSPTYGSHLYAWRQAEQVPSVADIPADAVVAIVVNPNNPDGRITPPADLPQPSLLIVDEAFADVAPDASLIPSMHGRNAVVLRSLGKFYGLAGLRLGFIAASPVAAAMIFHNFGDWPVSGPAIAIGTAALNDEDWRTRMRVQLKREATNLRALFALHDLAIVGGTDLFVLVECDDAHALHQALARHGIWTRAFADNPRWLRFGLPGAARMERLADALSAVR